MAGGVGSATPHPSPRSPRPVDFGVDRVHRARGAGSPRRAVSRPRDDVDRRRRRHLRADAAAVLRGGQRAGRAWASARATRVALFTATMPGMGLLLARRRPHRRGERGGERGEQGRLPAARAALSRAKVDRSPTLSDGPSRRLDVADDFDALQHGGAQTIRPTSRPVASTRDLLAGASTTRQPDAVGRADEPAALFFTSGTTGTIESGCHDVALPVHGGRDGRIGHGSSPRARRSGRRCRCST